MANKSTRADRHFDECIAKVRSTIPDSDTLARARADYWYFVYTYFPEYAVAAIAKFHLQAANAVRANPHYQGVWPWFRGAAKSTHACLLVPLWLMLQHPSQLRFMLLIGKSEADAIRLLSDIKKALESNTRLLADIGPQHNSGHWEAAEFITRAGVGFLAKGMGQSPRGIRIGAQRPDYIVADDLDYAALSLNPRRVRQLTDWLLQDVLGTADVGRGRFVQVGNRFSRNTLIHTLMETGAFEVLRVDALDDAGRPTWPAKYGDGAWFRAREAVMGHLAFAREYMNTPLVEGAVFKPHWLQWRPALPPAEYDRLVCYIDPSYTATPHSDYKAAKLWGSSGVQLHHLRAFVRRCSMAELVGWCYRLDAELQAAGANVEFFMEGNLMQDLLLDAFHAEAATWGYVLPLRSDLRRKGSKQQRLEAMSALWERGVVHYDESQEQDPDMQLGLQQLLAFEPGSSAHDDGPDADEGALWLLRRSARLHASGEAIIGRAEREGWGNVKP